jgi:hypothetical protein
MDSRFRIHHARIRWNSLLGTDAALHVVGDEDTFVGTLALRGWTEENCAITDCFFEKDETLKPGQLLIEPLGDRVDREGNPFPGSKLRSSA